MDKTRYWRISHGADTTETGYCMFVDYVMTRWDGFPMQQCCGVEILRDWCRERYGKEVEYVQGVAPCPNWAIGRSTKGAFQNAQPILWGGRPSGVPRQIRLSIGDRGEVREVRDDNE